MLTSVGRHAIPCAGEPFAHVRVCGALMQARDILTRSMAPMQPTTITVIRNTHGLRVTPLVDIGHRLTHCQVHEALPMAEPTPATSAALRNLHPAAAPPVVPATTAAPVNVSLQMLRNVLQAPPRGSALSQVDGFTSTSRLPQPAWTQHQG